MTTSTINLNRALTAWAATHEYGVLAATQLLIEHGSWLRRSDFLAACVGGADSPMPWISWRAAKLRLDDGDFIASSSELIILDLAITLALDSHRTSLLGNTNRESVARAFGLALGVTRPSAVTQ
jgi:hypothetical protein